MTTVTTRCCQEKVADVASRWTCGGLPLAVKGTVPFPVTQEGSLVCEDHSRVNPSAWGNPEFWECGRKQAVCPRSERQREVSRDVEGTVYSRLPGKGSERCCLTLWAHR